MKKLIPFLLLIFMLMGNQTAMGAPIIPLSGTEVTPNAYEPPCVRIVEEKAYIRRIS